MTFSRYFPAYHPKRGEPTYFVEAILTQLGIDYTSHDYFAWLTNNNPDINIFFLLEFIESLSINIDPKSHTIRAHKKPLKVGQLVNPKCWAGKPYNKTKEGYWQIKFAPDIEVKKTWPIRIDLTDQYELVYLIDELGDAISVDEKKLASNDGLTEQDFYDWFDTSKNRKKVFAGQVVCWNEKIEY
jgi:hypothetical protein